MTDENYLQWGLWQKKADELAAENRRLKAELDALVSSVSMFGRHDGRVHRIDELPQAVRIAVSTAAKSYVHRWLAGEPNSATRMAIDELVQLLVNVYILPERDAP